MCAFLGASYQEVLDGSVCSWRRHEAAVCQEAPGSGICLCSVFPAEMTGQSYVKANPSPQDDSFVLWETKEGDQGNFWPLPRAALFTTSAPQHTNLRALQIFSGSVWWVHGECGCKTGRRLQFLWPLGLSHSVPSPGHASR